MTLLLTGCGSCSFPVIFSVVCVVFGSKRCYLLQKLDQEKMPRARKWKVDVTPAPNPRRKRMALRAQVGPKGGLSAMAIASYTFWETSDVVAAKDEVLFRTPSGTAVANVQKELTAAGMEMWERKIRAMRNPPKCSSGICTKLSHTTVSGCMANQYEYDIHVAPYCGTDKCAKVLSKRLTERIHAKMNPNGDHKVEVSPLTNACSSCNQFFAQGLTKKCSWCRAKFFCEKCRKTEWPKHQLECKKASTTGEAIETKEVKATTASQTTDVPTPAASVPMTMGVPTVEEHKVYASDNVD
jgi:hypothetical protein